MRLVVLVALASCGGDRPTAPVGSASGSAVRGDAAVAPPAVPPPSIDICKAGLDALAHATCPSAEVRQGLMNARKSFDGIAATIAKVGDADPTQFHVMCAQMLIALERDALKASCQIALPAAQRAEVQKLLDAWYAQRTPVAPTGDGAADVVIARLVAIREATCECRDGACLDRVGERLAEITPMHASAPETARTLAKKVLEDAGRCASRVRAAQ